MATRTRRKNEALLDWLRAALVTLATFAALSAMEFRPAWGAATLALVAGGLTLLSVDLGIIAAIAALALPITAANAVVGIIFAIVGVVSVRYLGADGGRLFLLVAGAFAGVVLGPAWFVIPLAGYLMGPGEGALAAAIACLSVELAGLAAGAKAGFGQVTVNGGGDALTSFAKAPDTLFSAAWLADSFGSIGTKSVDQVVGVFGNIGFPLALALQPGVWALGAAVAGVITRESRRRNQPLLLLAAVAVGVAIPAAGAWAIYSAVDLELPLGALAVATAGSLLIAAGVVALLERVFPLEIVSAAAPVAAPRPASMAMEDADVDELLRLVATAEEKLTTQHTTQKVVMITDMKSFSKMTEEDGSIMSAKAIQKHRDLLLPVVDRHRGHGKSTGGDGLVAAFDDAQSALEAAVDMQRTLFAHNTAHPGEREMVIRIGVAQGEVVLDKGGRPFIGTALNLAARVMNLADGGQAYVTSDVVSLAKSKPPTYSHGPFELKNIAAPVDVIELLWRDDQVPRGPEGSISL
jgi:class 3 adenylate cyclase